MKKCFISYKTRIAIYLIFLAHVIVSAEKSNITLNEEDEKAFFSRLRNSINDNSDSSEEVDDEDGTHRNNSMAPPPMKLEYLPELLVQRKFITFGRKLARHLDVVYRVGSGMNPTHEGYRKFMFTVLRPLIRHGYLVKSMKETGNSVCDHLIVPKDNFRHSAFVMNYTVCTIEYLLPTVAENGLQKMMDQRMGSDIKTMYPMVKEVYRFFFSFYGAKVIMEYTH